MSDLKTILTQQQRFDQASDLLGSLISMRSSWIDKEGKKEAPDQHQIDQWQAETSKFHHVRNRLDITDDAAVNAIFTEYGEQQECEHIIFLARMNLSKGPEPTDEQIEQYTKACKTLGALISIRSVWAAEEKSKPSPDKLKIKQWEEDSYLYGLLRRSLAILNDENIADVLLQFEEQKARELM